MKIAQVQFSVWDKIYSFSMAETLNLAVGDFVIVNTELGQEIGKIVSFNHDKDLKQELKPILRPATIEEVEQVYDLERRKKAIEICQAAVNRLKLKMKLIDARFSLTANRLTFAFVSDNRVDFRELVKELSSEFNLNIRLFQIGSRDQAKVQGDCGPCGLKLCCRSFVKDFASISSEMAEAQQVAHRGSDRISGMCGRLMCCLSFEYEGYKHLDTELAPIGTKIKVQNKTGIVVGRHLLTQVLDVRFPADRHGERDQIVQIDTKQTKARKTKDLLSKKNR